MKELIIGSHVSFGKDKQLVGSVMEALSYGCNAFMFYTGAPQNTKRSEIDLNLTNEALNLMKENNIEVKNVVVHAPYIINLANNGNNYNFSVDFLKEEIKRVELLGIDKLVLHPGSHVGLGSEVGIKNIIDALNQVITKDQKVIVGLETMAGKGSEVGSYFEQIKQIIDGVKYNEKIGVCLDTCHINDAGYDLSDFDKVLEEFDKVIGLDKLICVHVNDSKNNVGDHKDRHENFGFGTIGFDKLLNIVYHDKLKGIPKILETPYVTLTDNDKKRLYPPYKFEIDMIRNKKFDNDLLNNIRNYYK